jgi:hypothetical protein
MRKRSRIGGGFEGACSVEQAGERKDRPRIKDDKRQDYFLPGDPGRKQASAKHFSVDPLGTELFLVL